MPFQILIRIYDPYRRVSINRYSYYRVPTAAFRKLAFRLGGVLIFQPLGAGTTRPGGLAAGSVAVAGRGPGGPISKMWPLGLLLGLSWLILSLLGPLWARPGASWASPGSS